MPKLPAGAHLIDAMGARDASPGLVVAAGAPAIGAAMVLERTV